MKTNKLGFILLIFALFVTPLFCVKNSLFNSGKHDSIGMLKSQLYANSKAKQLDLDMAKCFYLPDEWVFWYRMDEVGCSNVTEEDRYN
ncbi:MAG: hypothetical protein PHO32_05240, partial [Candidatus Cloacimonetes bacterium]|nr:hypothetical protein [Candidatus Cloacimonadota bacterium]